MSPLSGAYVQWDATNIKNLYRCGYEGMVNLTKIN
jgi:hypothetical protein